MENNLRKTGIDIPGDLPWGTHLCLFYETPKDLLDVLIPYFKAGLEHNEFCLWVTSDPITVHQAMQALQEAVPGFDRYLEKQSIEILPYTDWYLKGGRFHAATLIDAWNEKLQNALARGYDGLRANGNETWLRPEDWEDFMNYERELNKALREKPMILLCAYALSNIPAGALLDVAHAHESVVSKRKGQWDVLEVPVIKKTKAQLDRQNEELNRCVAERTRELDRVIGELRKEIAERKEAEEKLTGEKELSRAIIESFPGIYKIVDNNYRILDWNRRFEVQTGYTAPEIPRLHALNDLHFAHDLNRIAALMQEAFTTGLISAEVTMRMKDGSSAIFYYIARRFNYEDRPCLICCGIDITKRKKAEEEVHRAYQRLSYHVENSPLAVIECDKDFFITRWSGQAEKIFGWKASEALGKRMHDPDFPIVYTEDHSKVDKIAHELVQGQVDRNLSLNRNYTKDGQVIYCEWYNSVLRNEQGNVITILSLVHDVTDQRIAEENIHQSYQQIRSLTEHLQNIREEERAHIAREIHDELGQQLTVLKMDVSWLGKKLDAKDDAVSKKLQDLNHLLDSTVQSVRRISAELRPSLLDDLGLVAAMDWHLQEFGKRAGIKTFFREPEEEPELPGPVKTGLYRIFQESLTNVARHAQASEVKVDLGQQNGHFILKISDNGRGFDLQASGKKKTLGILGMEERAAMMGGTYKIGSEPGKGTTIFVTIPLPSQNQPL